jgi:hypothetical protein
MYLSRENDKIKKKNPNREILFGTNTRESSFNAKKNQLNG